MMLADLGAEVVKVEHPQGGDTARGNGPYIHGYSSYFLSINRGKKSITADLATDAGRDLLLDLAKHADVLVENFVPGAMDRFGLGQQTVLAANPRLVYCSISGFGQNGPYARMPALDVIVQGMGGIMSITGEPGGPPIRPGASMGDIAAGMFAAVGILSALVERAVSGRGQYLDLSMMDCQVAIQENAFARFFATGQTPGPLGTRHPVFTPFQAFETSDGWIVVAIVGGRNDQWPLFCAAIERVDLIDDPRYADGGLRTQHYDTLGPILTQALKQRPAAEWLKTFRDLELPCGPVSGIDAVAADPQIAAREMIVERPTADGAVVKLVNTPIKLSRTPGRIQGLSPDLGEHTQAVLAEWLGQAAPGGSAEGCST